MRSRLVVIRASAAAALALAAGLCSCNRPGGEPGPLAASTAVPSFEDMTPSSGIDFERDNGHDTKSWRVVETVNGGLALLDFDSDGRLDIYFTNGRPPGSATAAGNRLYRNTGDWKFEDVSAASGTADDSLGLGCAAADIDGDGLVDLYVTNLGPNRLYRNLGGGRFTDIAAKAGVARDSMDAGAVFFDMDRDGDLDLYVASYMDDTKVEHAPLVYRGVPGYWPPTSYEAAPDQLYENLGNGSFVDVSETSGIRTVLPGRGLGVLSADFNGDGNADLYVANDMSENFMFIGDGEGGFEEQGLFNGSALGQDGSPLGSMGLDSGDFDGDGHSDLFVTNYYSQPNNLYRSRGGADYEDSADVTAADAGSLPEVSWGVGFFDFNLDGWLDIYVANGHLNPFASDIVDTASYAQGNRLYRNRGDGGFEDRTTAGGKALEVRQVSRGAAFGDLDNDGDVDIVVCNSRGLPQLLRNAGVSMGHWAQVKLVGKGLNTGAIGAHVSVSAGGTEQQRTRRSAASYLSVNDPRLHFGLGRAANIERLTVSWPGGERQVHEGLPADRLLVVREGETEIEIIDPGPQ